MLDLLGLDDTFVLPLLFFPTYALNSKAKDRREEPADIRWVDMHSLKPLHKSGFKGRESDQHLVVLCSSQD
jgi:hypothetical protein